MMVRQQGAADTAPLPVGEDREEGQVVVWTPGGVCDFHRAVQALEERGAGSTRLL